MLDELHSVAQPVTIRSAYKKLGDVHELGIQDWFRPVVRKN